jgi:hypothetical protein
MEISKMGEHEKPALLLCTRTSVYMDGTLDPISFYVIKTKGKMF